MSKVKIMKILTIIMIVVILLLPIIIIVVNDNISRKLEKELKSIPLPNNTEIVDSIAVAGKLNGNGNGMQYLGAILIKTELDEESLENHYRAYRKGKWDCLIKKQDTDMIDLIEHGRYKFKNFNSNKVEEYYMIYSWGSNENEFLNLDIRGH